MKKLDNEQLLNEANRCYGCKVAKCQKNCPINTPIPQIIELFKANKIEEAGEILFNNNPLSAVCGIVCAHENQCYGHCIRSIKDESVKFYEMESLISRKYLENTKFDKVVATNDKVAIIGAGPAGIALAFILAKKGYQVTIFECNADIGGVLRYGIPEFRLPREILQMLKERLLEVGVKIRYNTLVGPVLTLDKLQQDGFKAIFIGTGVWDPKPLNIKGESLGHVCYAIDYLAAPTAYTMPENVVVIGAGNVAMDAARTAKYYGAKNVSIVYRKDFEDMPATKVEIEEAKEDGVNFNLFKAPVEIVEDGLICIDTKTIIGEDGRKSMVTVEGSEKLIESEFIIIAVSQSPKKNLVSSAKDLETNKYGLIVTDELGHTTKKGVFASGDVVTGARTVVEAVANAKVVANSIEEYLKNLS